jgi:D-sedoheptulose 7-phosphate isomerase
VALLGGDGGDIARAAVADHQVVVPSADPRVVKEVHVTTYHVLWELVHVFLEQPGVLAPEVIT